jgi:hypothetical protein
MNIVSTANKLIVNGFKITQPPLNIRNYTALNIKIEN